MSMVKVVRGVRELVTGDMLTLRFELATGQWFVGGEEILFAVSTAGGAVALLGWDQCWRVGPLPYWRLLHGYSAA